MATEEFDIVIIGGGPAGLSAGTQAAVRTRSHLVLERGSTLADTIEKYYRGKHVMAAPYKLELQPDNPIRFHEGTREAVLDAFKEGVTKTGAQVRLNHEVLRIEGDAPCFTVTAQERVDGSARQVQFTARHVIVAMGTQGNVNTLVDRRTKPYVPPPGALLDCVRYQLSDPREFAECKVIVVGAGNSALENALALADPKLELKNQVFLVCDGERDKFPKADPRNVELLNQAVADQRITYLPASTIARIERSAGSYTASVEGKSAMKLEAIDAIICRLGGDPPKQFLAKAGIEFTTDKKDERPRRKPTFETFKPGLFVVGSTADADLIKLAMNEGFEVIEHICGRPVVPMDVPELHKNLVVPLRINEASASAAVNSAVEYVRARIPVLQAVDALSVRRLLFNGGVVRPLPDGAELFRHKDQGQEVFALIDGSLRIDLPSSTGVRSVAVPAGELLGELSFFEDSYRKGTATATADSLVLSLRRNPLIAATRTATVLRETLDRTYAYNKLRNFFEPHAPKDAETRARVLERLQALAADVKEHKVKNGDYLFRQGDAAGPDTSGLIVIKRGSMAVMLERDGSRQAVVAHRLAGSVLGESGVLSDKPRSASLMAVAPTEVIRYQAAGIKALLKEFPPLDAALKDLVGSRLVENGKYVGADSADVTDLLKIAGAGEATDILLIKDDLCIGCDNCEAACAAIHQDGITRLDREAGKTYASVHVPTTCRHCTNASCMTECPPDVITRLPTGEIVIDTEHCIGCHKCADNCPYGVIQFVDPAPVRSFVGLKGLLTGWWSPTDDAKAKGTKGPKATKCDLCAFLPGRPACEVACPTGALIRVHPEEYLRARDEPD